MFRILALLFPLLFITGCAAVRAGDPGQPVQFPPAQTAWRSAPAVVDASAYFSTRNEGLAAAVRELDHLAELVGIVGRMAHEPGEFTVDFALIQADIAALRAGLIEAIRKPTTAPRVYQPLSADYVR